jgi:hypothetical protein
MVLVFYGPAKPAKKGREKGKIDELNFTTRMRFKMGEKEQIKELGMLRFLPSLAVMCFLCPAAVRWLEYIKKALQRLVHQTKHSAARESQSKKAF